MGRDAGVRGWVEEGMRAAEEGGGDVEIPWGEPGGGWVEEGGDDEAMGWGEEGEGDAGEGEGGAEEGHMGVEEIELSVPGIRQFGVWQGGVGDGATNAHGQSGGDACGVDSLGAGGLGSHGTSGFASGARRGAVESLERLLSQLPGVASAAISVRAGTVTVEAVLPPPALPRLHARLRAVLRREGLHVEEEGTLEEQVRGRWGPGIKCVCGKKENRCANMNTRGLVGTLWA